MFQQNPNVVVPAWIAGTGTVMGMFAEMLASATDAVSGSFSYLSNNYV